MASVKVRITKKGAATLEANGVVGPICKTVLEPFVKACGQTVSVSDKPEAFQAMESMNEELKVSGS